MSILTVGSVITVTVTMSEPTVVSGVPTLSVLIGNATVQAVYVSGSGTNK